MRLADVLDPDNEPGRLTLIHRMGAAKIEAALPPLLAAIKTAGRKPLFCCDPMHGNTETLGNGFKTRRFQNIRDELDRAFDIHAAVGTRLGGVHLELTGENVTECMGGARDLTETDLTRAYKSTVDPRLNYEQSLELAMLIVRKRGGVRLRTSLTSLSRFAGDKTAGLPFARRSGPKGERHGWRECTCRRRMRVALAA